MHTMYGGIINGARLLHIAGIKYISSRWWCEKCCAYKYLNGTEWNL